MLRDYALQVATMVSYEQSAFLVAARTGRRSLSDQRIYQVVAEYAETIKEEQAAQIQAMMDEASNSPCVAACPVDIYDSNAQEIHFFSDGVCVNKQKAVRDKVAKQGKERSSTDIYLLQTKIADANSFKTIVAASGIDPIALIQSEVIKAYGNLSNSLPIVAISDGARCIKTQNKAIFGAALIHILDWYHLEAKVHQYMSQIAPNKALKEECSHLLTNALWVGNVCTAVLALKFMPVKNEQKRDELIGYLEKNEDYIINYKKRKEAGKTIGSGRTEKQNDLIIAQRQKDEGIAWSPGGSNNLAIVTAYHLKQAT